MRFALPVCCNEFEFAPESRTESVRSIISCVDRRHQRDGMPKDTNKKRAPSVPPKPAAKSTSSLANRGRRSSSASQSAGASSNLRSQPSQHRSGTVGTSVVGLPEATQSDVAAAEPPAFQPPPAPGAIVGKVEQEESGELQAVVYYEQTKEKEKVRPPPVGKSSEITISGPNATQTPSSRFSWWRWRRPPQSEDSKLPVLKAPSAAPASAAVEEPKVEPDVKKLSADVAQPKTDESGDSRATSTSTAAESAAKLTQLAEQKRTTHRVTIVGNIEKKTTPQDSGDYDFVQPMAHSDRVLSGEGIKTRVETADPIAVTTFLEREADIVTRATMPGKKKPQVAKAKTLIGDVGAPPVAERKDMAPAPPQDKSSLPIKRKISRVEVNLVPVKDVERPAAVEREIGHVRIQPTKPDTVPASLPDVPAVELPIERVSPKVVEPVPREPILEKRIESLSAVPITPSVKTVSSAEMYSKMLSTRASREIVKQAPLPNVQADSSAAESSRLTSRESVQPSGAQLWSSRYGPASETTMSSAVSHDVGEFPIVQGWQRTFAGPDIHQFIRQMMHPAGEIPIESISNTTPKETLHMVYVDSEGSVVDSTKNPDTRG